MTLQLHSEFPDRWGKFDFFFISAMVTKILLLDEVTMPTYVHGAPWRFQ
jgi:hypothetical protein